LIVAGASAGVSVAFGAPIGGALFLYELSRLNPLWKFDVLWKTFITCGVAVFVAAMCDNILHGIPISFSESALKFAKARPEMSVPASVLPGAFIIGCISGLLGAFFLGVNFRLAKIRTAIETKKWHKLFDAFIFAFLTATTFYWLPKLF
jgi:H+/Cl- antiporter ClcA